VISEEGLAGMNRKLVCLVSLFSIGVIAAAIFYVLPAATQRAKSLEQSGSALDLGLYRP